MLGVRQFPEGLGPQVDGGIDLAALVAGGAILRQRDEAEFDLVADFRADNAVNRVVADAIGAGGINDEAASTPSSRLPISLIVVATHRPTTVGALAVAARAGD